MSVLVHAVGRPELTPLKLSDRFRHEISYFMSVPGAPGVPPLGPAEYWVAQSEANEIYDSGVVRLVSPLDTDNKAEVEITEEHEIWLEWMLKHRIEHIRLS